MCSFQFSAYLVAIVRQCTTLETVTMQFQYECVVYHGSDITYHFFHFLPTAQAIQLLTFKIRREVVLGVWVLLLCKVFLYPDAWFAAVDNGCLLLYIYMRESGAMEMQFLGVFNIYIVYHTCTCDHVCTNDYACF